MNVSKISAGSSFNCAITTAGAVKCWGRNYSGELGNGANADLATPTSVLGLPGDVISISLGGSTACVLTSGSEVWCWGDNSYGQLGDGTTVNRNLPVKVAGTPSSIKTISAGEQHLCMLSDVGGVWCLGRGSNGQLGNGSTANRGVPTAVSGMTSGVKGISTGGQFSCAIASTGATNCWGENENGQLGNNSVVRSTTPVAVSGMTGTAALASGGTHSCGITTAGGIRCWGGGYAGQIGDGGTTDRKASVAILSSGVASLSLGGQHTCAVTTAGGLKCWGGMPVDGTSATRTVPTDVTGLTSGVASVANGGGGTCVSTTAGEMRCWGYNAYGQVGDGTKVYRYSPVTVLP